ncbi:MAG: methyltransferase [Hyphomicrobiales bacterium]|nr:methyltransferase [Hyphomicrobiales bacterium]
MHDTALPAIEAPLNFMVRGHEKPQIFMSVDQAEPNRRTGEFETIELAIADARALAEPPTLDGHGFALVNDATAVTDFYDENAIPDVYYPEIVRLLKKETGASDVHIFDHTLRVQDEAKRREHGTRLPVPMVHNDYTERSGPARVRDLLEPAKAEKFLAHRFAMVNVWRSFGASAERLPLAVADGRTIRTEDFIAVDIVYHDRTGEIFYNAHCDDQRWYYFSNMHRDEALLLKCYDTAEDGRTRYTAHTGFENSAAPADTPPRESIEVRTLLSFGPD